MHDMAFGTGLKEDDVPALVEYANKTLSNVDFGILLPALVSRILIHKKEES